MKFSTILFIVFSFNSCGNTNAITSMQENNIQELSGTYIITRLGINNSLPENLTIEFDEKTNHVSGFSGCNRFSGSYTIDGNNIKFSPLASTRMMCLNDINIIESHILSFLNDVNSFSIKGNNLTLLKGNKPLIVAKRDSFNVIEYTASSRGSFKQVTLKDNVISYQKARDLKPV